MSFYRIKYRMSIFALSFDFDFRKTAYKEVSNTKQKIAENRKIFERENGKKIAKNCFIR